MTIIFTPSKLTKDNKRTHNTHDGSVPQGNGHTAPKVTREIKVTEYGVKPPLTPVEVNRELNWKKFLSRFQGEREF